MILSWKQHGHLIDVQGFSPIKAIKPVSLDSWIVKGMLSGNGHRYMFIMSSIIQTFNYVVAHLESLPNVLENLKMWVIRLEEKKLFAEKFTSPSLLK